VKRLGFIFLSEIQESFTSGNLGTSLEGLPDIEHQSNLILIRGFNARFLSWMFWRLSTFTCSARL
jgi:hypothetical protein